MSAAAMRLRVTSADTWTSADLAVAPDDSVASVKARVLAGDRVPATRLSEYEVKHGGALVADESRSLASLGIGEGAALIVLLRRRRPVR